MNVATTIALVLLVLAVIGNTISIWYVSNKKESSSFIPSRPLSEHTSHENNNRIKKLEETLEDVQPLIDKYKKERKQNHWKQYNDWKCLYESKLGRCEQCHGEELEIDTDYKHVIKRIEGRCLVGDIDYPELAVYKCNTCDHVIDKWEFEEEL